LKEKILRDAAKLLALNVDDFLRILRTEYEITDETQLAAARAFWMKHYGF